MTVPDSRDRRSHGQCHEHVVVLATAPSEDGKQVLVLPSSAGSRNDRDRLVGQGERSACLPKGFRTCPDTFGARTSPGASERHGSDRTSDVDETSDGETARKAELAYSEPKMANHLLPWTEEEPTWAVVFCFGFLASLSQS